jgi:hypothetical protein
MPGLLENLWKKGELPELRTAVEFETQSLVRLAVTAVIVTIVILLVHKALKLL